MTLHYGGIHDTMYYVHKTGIASRNVRTYDEEIVAGNFSRDESQDVDNRQNRGRRT